MIAFVRGRLAWIGADAAIVDVSGVGYRVLVPDSTRRKLPPKGQVVELRTSFQVREDSMTLYGFVTEEEFELFELLLTVSMIGPKVALGVLSATTPADFRRAVAFDDITSLTRLPNIGKKTAQRMVLELKDKLGSLLVSDQDVPGITPAAALGAAALGDKWSEALEALVGLGYARPEAAAALERARPGVDQAAPVPELVRQGLRQLVRL